MIKFVKFDSIKQPDPIPLEVKRHPCVYGHPCLESREEEVDSYFLTRIKEEEEGEKKGDEASTKEETGDEGEKAEGEEENKEGGEAEVEERKEGEDEKEREEVAAKEDA
ncbi:uncharacterized protein isoform X2 [Rhodnius prolixus]